MKFKPKTESELSNFDPFPEGEYPFTVMESEEVASKSAKNAGKLMCKVKLCIHGDGEDRHVYDYFADWFSEWKLKHFCETTGLRDEYAMGEVTPNRNAWQERTGFVKLIVVPATGNFPAKNEVKDYLPDEEQKIKTLEPEAKIDPKTAERGFAKVKAAVTEPTEDDVPF